MIRAAFQPVKGWTNSFKTTAATTSLSLDITGALVGEWIYSWVCFNTNVNAPTLTGWTSVATSSRALVGNWTLFRRRKVSGDTTFSMTWTSNRNCCTVMTQYSGLDPVAPDEGATLTNVGTGGPTFTTPSATPTQANRWAMALFASNNGDTTNQVVTWDTPSGLTKAKEDTTVVASPYPTGVIFDSEGPVAVSSQSYTSTGRPTTNMGAGCSGLLFLIPAQTPLQSSIATQVVNRSAVF